MNLLLFNLKTDADDNVLGFTTDWINALSKNFDKVFVITMHAGRIDVADNVTVYSVGKEKGFSELRRFVNFYKILFKILNRDKVDACFAHMMPLFSVMGWPVLRLKTIPIVLWYGHKATPFILKVAHRLVDKVVTSVAAGFGLKSNKVVLVGQGIPENKFFYRKIESKENGPFTIISVARISKIKNIDLMIQAVKRIVDKKGKDSVRLLIIGDALTPNDIEYRSKLIELVTDLNMESNIEFGGAVPYIKVADWIRKANLSINLAPTGAIDKSALESLAMGVPLVVQNISFNKVFNECGVKEDPFVIKNFSLDALVDAILYWMNLSDEFQANLMKKVSEGILCNHGLSGLASRITVQIKEVVKNGQ